MKRNPEAVNGFFLLLFFFLLYYYYYYDQAPLARFPSVSLRDTGKQIKHPPENTHRLTNKPHTWVHAAAGSGCELTVWLELASAKVPHWGDSILSSHCVRGGVSLVSDCVSLAERMRVGGTVHSLWVWLAMAIFRQDFLDFPGAALCVCVSVYVLTSSTAPLTLW